MNYHLSRIVPLPFNAAVAATTAALQNHGFGVLTEIDVQATLRKKLDVKFRPYRILGACNPKMAYQALRVEDKVGTMLPCNVIVQQREDGAVEVSAIDPVASMQAIENPELVRLAESVRDMLRQVVEQIGWSRGVEYLLGQRASLDQFVMSAMVAKRYLDSKSSDLEKDAFISAKEKIDQ